MHLVLDIPCKAALYLSGRCVSNNGKEQDQLHGKFTHFFNQFRRIRSNVDGESSRMLVASKCSSKFDPPSVVEARGVCPSKCKPVHVHCTVVDGKEGEREEMLSNLI